MDINDLQRLASYLEERGLRVTLDGTAMRLDVTNLLNSRLSEEILVKDERYVTGFDYEIGEAGGEAECADRIAHILVVTTERAPSSVRSDSPVTRAAGPAEVIG
ncbi:hypothetical protein [Streptomyces regalis]|uniref:Uncharacterized protein n=1 Tax=Streptomyces regalis TaxID=68262 RepID=A0A0X3VEL9_9ACTN|nr:hypothetical protein [Streptomyces regalis]KUL42702.1 hypothetical protein ADL12_09520 [Streptomyces regalis]